MTELQQHIPYAVVCVLEERFEKNNELNSIGFDKLLAQG